jgi:hypothetical protein
MDDLLEGHCVTQVKEIFDAEVRPDVHTADDQHCAQQKAPPRARDTKLKSEVALKILPETLANDPQRMARFQREAEVLASLNHPHIAQIYGVDRLPVHLKTGHREAIATAILDRLLHHSTTINIRGAKPARP